MSGGPPQKEDSFAREETFGNAQKKGHEKKYDFFLSHSSEDKAHVRAIYSVIRTAKLRNESAS
jgi:hypothetical protein